MKNKIESLLVVGALTMGLAGAASAQLATTTATAPLGDPFVTILKKLDQILDAVAGITVDVDLDGVTQNWDEALDKDRFVPVLGGAAIRDNETGLVWEQAPATTTHTWSQARFQCAYRATGGRRGWRLPSVHELATLLDPARSGPSLPDGHPFANVAPSPFNGYWTATTDAEGGAVAWAVNVYSGLVGGGSKTLSSYVGCVRGAGDSALY
jgi:hypothetical protein